MAFVPAPCLLVDRLRDPEPVIIDAPRDRDRLRDVDRLREPEPILDTLLVRLRVPEPTRSVRANSEIAERGSVSREFFKRIPRINFGLLSADTRGTASLFFLALAVIRPPFFDAERPVGLALIDFVINALILRFNSASDIFCKTILLL